MAKHFSMNDYDPESSYSSKEKFSKKKSNNKSSKKVDYKQMNRERKQMLRDMY